MFNNAMVRHLNLHEEVIRADIKYLKCSGLYSFIHFKVYKIGVM
jgi:hypothetical protein